MAPTRGIAPLLYSLEDCCFPIKLRRHNMVPRVGLEPTQTEVRQILSLLCLPISPPGQNGVP